MKTSNLVSRLEAADPGWSEWAQLIAVVKHEQFTHVQNEYLGSYLVCPRPLCFKITEHSWPAWIPAFATALCGLKATDYEMAGGFAEAFTGAPSRRGALFAQAGNDDALGYPLLSVPADTYPFQTTSGGSLVHLNRSLEVLYPNVDREALVVFDSLERFAIKNISAVLHGRCWLSAYPAIGELLE
jgi:hypothetical protein